MRTLAIAIAVTLAACGGDDDSDGAGASDGGGSAIDGASDRFDAQAAVSCDDYCASLMASCPDTLAQYRDLPSCLASCPLFPPGTPGADSGDSMACRLTYAALAVDDPDPHCRHAGPSGGGVCGALCDAYCDLMMAVCDLYTDDGECMETCAGWPVTGEYSSAPGYGRGDSVECRILHATMAAADPDTHCGTAGPDSTPCADM